MLLHMKQHMEAKPAHTVTRPRTRRHVKVHHLAQLIAVVQLRSGRNALSSVVGVSSQLGSSRVLSPNMEARNASMDNSNKSSKDATRKSVRRCALVPLVPGEGVMPHALVARSRGNSWCSVQHLVVVRSAVMQTVTLTQRLAMSTTAQTVTSVLQ